VLIDNVQLLIDSEKSFANKTGDYHSNYHSFDEINTFLKSLADKYPSVVTYLPSIGATTENRQIPLITLRGSTHPTKRIWIQAMQHAREWIAGSTAQYLADMLASKYGADDQITKLLNQVEIIIVPVCNPDGYEYARKTDRMWRKNRGEASGVDTNRNWPDHWNGGGSSDDPDDETYKGVSAASSLEVQALMKAYQSYDNIIAAVDFHSFSQLVLRPYGWSGSNSPDEEQFIKLGEAIQKAYTSGTEHNSYVSERIADLYVASGGASDWFYNAGTKVGSIKPYGITIELPPTSVWQGGFVLPPKRIVPVGKDSLSAVLTLANFALTNPLGIKKTNEGDEK